MKRFAVTPLAALVVMVALVVSCLGNARAATLGGLTISPTSIDQTIAPGAKYQGQILIINQGQQAVGYQVYPSPYNVSGEDYTPDFQPLPGASDVTKWFSFTKIAGNLQVEQQEVIPFTLTVPAGTPAGSYYATVFAQTNGQPEGGVTTRTRVGTVIYIRVSGQVVEKGSLEEWNVPWLQQPPLTATVKAANGGTVHYTAQTKMTISDIFGGPKFTIERDPKILPQKLRRITLPWDKGAQFGLYKVGGEVTYLGKTQILPTRLVLVASTTMRALLAMTLICFVVIMIFIGKTKVKRKAK